MGPRGPEKSSESMARLPLAASSIEWRAVTSMPRPRVIQVKLRPSSSSVICQPAGRSLGWRTMAVFPTTSGPGSRRRTLMTVGVHSDQCSMSRTAAQTRQVAPGYR